MTLRHFPRPLPSLCGIALALAALQAPAGTLSGTVSSEGKPLAGAMVTAFDSAKKRRDTAYTDAAGHYRLSVDFGGPISVRARAPYYKDVAEDVTLAVDGQLAKDFTLTRHSVGAELSASLSASAHLTKLDFKSADTRSAFISQCNFCHQVGNELTRGPKDEAGWAQTVRRMESYFAMLTNQEAKDITKTLAKGFDGQPVAGLQQYAFHPEVAHAKVKEWVVALWVTRLNSHIPNAPRGQWVLSLEFYSSLAPCSPVGWRWRVAQPSSAASTASPSTWTIGRRARLSSRLGFAANALNSSWRARKSASAPSS